MKRLLFVVCALALLSVRSEAQSIVINSVSSTVLCSGDSLDVNYTATGSFTNRNSFTVQLSDIEGNFTPSFKNIGSKRTPGSGMIRVAIPNVVAGTKYRIRIISSEPYVVGEVYAANFSLGPVPQPIGTIEGMTIYTRFYAALVDSAITFESKSTGASAVRWDFGPDAIPTTSNQIKPIVRFTTPGRKEIKLTAYGIAGCAREWTNKDLTLAIVTCTPSIPKSAVIDSAGVNYLPDHGENLDVWAVPGGVVTDVWRSTVFAEPGSTIGRSSMGNNVYYLKAGVEFASTYSRDDVAVYEEGVGFTDPNIDIQLIKCPDLEFDYSDAPPYKIKPASVARLNSSSVQVYPNPVIDRLTIEHKESLVREIIIRNALGAEMIFVQPEGLGRTLIDVSKLAAGLYFLDILGEQEIETQKIVISR